MKEEQWALADGQECQRKRYLFWLLHWQEKVKRREEILLIKTLAFQKTGVHHITNEMPMNVLWLTPGFAMLLGLSDPIQELCMPVAMGLTNGQWSCSLRLERKKGNGIFILMVWWMILCFQEVLLHKTFSYITRVFVWSWITFLNSNWSEIDYSNTVIWEVFIYVK